MTKLLLSVHVLAAILAVGSIAVAASLFPRFAKQAAAEGPDGPEGREGRGAPPASPRSCTASAGSTPSPAWSYRSSGWPPARNSASWATPG